MANRVICKALKGSGEDKYRLLNEYLANITQYNFIYCDPLLEDCVQFMLLYQI